MAGKLTAAAIWDGFVIAFKKYDVNREAQILAQHPQLAGRNLDPGRIKQSLERARAGNRAMLRAAKTADITDKITSLLAFGAESVALVVAPYLDLPIDFAEEGLELLIKLPVLLAFLRRGQLAGTARLLSWEVLSLIPLAGQLFDFFRNNYLHHAYRLIREQALRELILQDPDWKN